MDQESFVCEPRYLDRPDLLRLREYWGYHFVTIARGAGEEDPHPDLYALMALSPDTLEEFGKREFGDREFVERGEQAPSYPCYRLPLPLPGGRKVTMEYHDVPEDACILFCLYPAPDTEPVILAGHYGQGWEPELRWSDVTRIAKGVEQESGDPKLAAAALLLLIPAVLYGVEPEAVRGQLEDAVRTLDLAPEEGANELARWLFDIGPGGDSYRARTEDPDVPAPFLAFLAD